VPGGGSQTAAECIENDRIGVAVVLVMAGDDHDRLAIFLEPSKPFVETAPSCQSTWDGVRRVPSSSARVACSPLSVLHLVHHKTQKIHNEKLQKY
jgi:hypothetical protein